MKYTHLITAALALSYNTAYAEQASQPGPDISLPSLSEPPPPAPPSVVANPTPQVGDLPLASTVDTSLPSSQNTETKAATSPENSATDKQLTAPETPKNSNSSQNSVDIGDTSLPPEILRLLKEKNINISGKAAAQATQSLQAEKEEAEKAKKAEEQRKKEEEEQVRLKEKQREEAVLPSIVHRAPYDYQINSSAQLYKRQYGPNNTHLPIARLEQEYSQYLFVAAVADDIGAIQALLNKGADINARSVSHGYTPLMYATQNRKYRAISHLIVHGAAVDVIGLDGKNALKIATDLNDSDAIGLLLSGGATPIQPASSSVASEYSAPQASSFEEAADVSINSEPLRIADDEPMDLS